MNHMPEIKMFATDIRTVDRWNLPFIRISTNNFGNGIIKDTIGESIDELGMPFSELNAIWWVNKHIADFGQCDYIGFCHYRRFFMQSSKPLEQFDDFNISNDLVIRPNDILFAMTKNNIDIIAPNPFFENYEQQQIISELKAGIRNHAFTEKYQWERSYKQGVESNTGLTLDEWKLFYDKLYENTPDNLKPAMQKAFLMQNVHFGTIFVMKKNLFDIYFNAMWKAICQTCIAIGRDRILDCNFRIIGYVMERLTSCFLHTLAIAGFKKISLPLAVLNAKGDSIDRTQTCKQAGLKCDVEGLKKFI